VWGESGEKGVMVERARRREGVFAIQKIGEVSGDGRYRKSKGGNGGVRGGVKGNKGRGKMGDGGMGGRWVRRRGGKQNRGEWGGGKRRGCVRGGVVWRSGEKREHVE